MGRKISSWLLIVFLFSVVFIFFFLEKGSLPINDQSGEYLGAQDFSLPIAGGIIPHHLLASHIIADYFDRLSLQNPRVLILAAPNHSDQGNFKILSSWRDWGTPYGLVKADKKSIERLILERLVGVDDEVLMNEHSIADIAPFVKRYLPKTSIIPLIFSGETNQRDVEVLAENLSGLIDSETIVLAAVDFSHYLKIEDAKKNDLKSLEIIKNFDYPKLFPLGNDYLDSPASIGFLLAMMEKSGKTSLEVLHHTNSGELLHDSFTDTTSYFSIVFH